MLLFLIFALIVVSGLIAYLGDQIGMKIGKKRLSIFGIRPKYTSIIITILTGVFIATISITLLMIASEDVRMAVFDMQGLLIKLNHLNQQVMEKDSLLKHTTENYNNKVKEMEVEIAQTTVELNNILLERDSLKNDLNETKDEYNKLKDLLDETKDQYQTVAQTKVELEDNILSLQDKVTELESQKQVLETERLALQDDKQSLEEDIKTMQKEIDQLTDKMTDVIVKSNALVLGSQLVMDNKDVVYRKGDLVYIESLDTIPGGTRKDGELIVDEFLARANQYVYKLNLRKEQNNGRSIQFENREDLLTIAQELVTSENEKILVAVFASKNIWVGEFLDAIITTEPNYRVFTKDEIICEKMIDSNQNPSVIEKEITDILDVVSEQAREKNILVTSAGSVGTIAFGDFFKIIETIKDQSGKIRVTVKASKDIWREDTLSSDNLTFNISRVGDLP